MPTTEKSAYGIMQINIQKKLEDLKLAVFGKQKMTGQN